MGQSWLLLNLDKRERSGRLGKLGEFWFSGIGCNLLYRILVPFESIPPRDPTTDAESEANNTPSIGSTTANVFIPDDERKIMIYERRQGPTDSHVPLTIGSWAGDRIICVGEDANTSCLPQDLLTPTELASLESDTNLYEYADENFTPTRPGY
ncbi:hypothetical protein BDN72DRAFT_901028 [Pluteus cervinus]|uniref:Uncharacterized protein n=1 Tax=Pluteus cervinus TaxID=181527 RepID=A0ACD3AHB5_9AGAR|nr:hypothetical protein BDN72DRAFT_901028 [Pluteus cervinus]